MMDVDGVLVRGRPKDGLHWSSSLKSDLGLAVEDLQREFFDLHWENVVLGRVALEQSLEPVLKRIAPHLSPPQFIAWWFEQDSRLDRGLMRDIARIRSSGTPVYLATNQEHLRAQYLMHTLGLAEHVDGIHYSAQLGARKPSREFFDKVASKTRFAPGELLLVDDNSDNILAATTAGWKAFHWTGEKSLTEAWNELEGQS